MAKLTNIVIHCSDSEFGSAAEIRRWHLANGWKDIGYHFVILNGYLVAKTASQTELRVELLDGSIEVGRFLDGDNVINGREIGAHALGYNDKSIGICLIGKKDFTDAQFGSLALLLHELMGKFNIDRSLVWGHYDLANKSCPNFNVQQFTKDMNLLLEHALCGAMSVFLDKRNRFKMGAL